MTERGQPQFPAVLNQLCAETESANGRQLSNVSLAAAIDVSHSYIAQLRKGQREPTLGTVESLATFFEVHPAYFVGGRRDRAPESLPQVSFRDRLNTLFDLARPPGKGEMTLDAVVAAVRDRGKDRGDTNWTISPSTIIDLRNGKNTNPRLRHVVMLAEVFYLEPTYFLDAELAQRINSELRFHRTMTELGVSALATRASELTEDVRNEIMRTLVKALRPEAEDAIEEILARPSRTVQEPAEEER
ncbi:MULTISPECIES: helix-turn-helix transcriptional regulator [unclassified Crossiella]|uniref:helix-turn-helix domain-containing protein n=1 Tax=unclassified Crossiella TaxID=2620835 RepID=UPI001FFED103|nr:MULTISPECIES: helix-turn-helix transcriptional regulator [unclassified Crossiella]MCK2243704.1 helix-turn-helix domain-containing protein [Crossiella sp. S99.2]MCK2257563.1 helix-turn-helix domain-containing protein [Crossiella sp. S99.1]